MAAIMADILVVTENLILSIFFALSPNLTP